jgi:hypothetical protein
MEISRFDDLTRALTESGRSRRGALRLLAGAALALVVGRQPEAAEAHNALKKCKKLKGRSKKKCVKKAKAHNATHAGTPCSAPDDCPPPAADLQCSEATCDQGTCGTRLKSPDQVCRAAACAGPTVELRAALCDGSSGTCPAPTTRDCTPFTCQGGHCRSDCNDDGDCAPGYYCPPGSMCKLPQSLGAPCRYTSHCLSGYCVRGVCCNGPCTGMNASQLGICAGGTCALICDEGWGDCSGTQVGCETDLTSSRIHCGECGNPCTGQCPEGGPRFCDGGVCGC